MSIKLSSWVEIVGVSSVVLSLIFVGVELRQNTRASEAQALLDLNSAFNEINMWKINTPELIRLRKKVDTSYDELTKAEKRRAINMFQIELNLFENAYMYFERGIIEKEQFDVYFRGICDFLKPSAVNRMWNAKEFFLQPKFEIYITQKCKN